MKKRFLSLFIISVILLLTSCNTQKDETSKKLNIVTTLFPQYDFVRAIAKDKADITLLVTPGTESHNFEPKTADMIKISDCDVFVYTGEYMETWAEKIISSLKSDKTKVCDTSKGIVLDKEEEHEEHEEHETEHHHDYDPHIWTSPINAIKMVENICDSICEIDSENKSFYEKNAEEYIKELQNVDSEFKTVINSKKNKKLIFGSRFPFHYFVKEYGLKYDSAFDSCSGETEPGVKVMARLTDEIKKENIKTVFYTELSDTRVAEALCDGTNAKSALFHSCHNVTKDEFEKGETYISLMKNNVEALKDGLE